MNYTLKGKHYWNTGRPFIRFPRKMATLTIINQSPTYSHSVSNFSGVCFPLSYFSELKKFGHKGSRSFFLRGIRAEAMATEKLGIKIEKNPPETKLTALGVKQWPKWGCRPSKFPWTYDAKETCYLLQGKVKVYPDGGNNDFVEFGAGDLVQFPKGMSCTWEVSEAVDKHYKFE